MAVAGTYLLSSNVQYSEWLSSLGIPADSVAKMVAAKPKVEITQSGNDLVVKTTVGEKNFTNTITVGKESKATLPGGVEYTMNLTLTGSTLKGTWSMGGKSGDASVKFTASGATQSMTLGDITAKRVYTRQ
ncbi:fatty acid-binding protein, liver-like [Homarus americanus]|uniref:fatty acid-binding protein, liver-like n=1 Tax=Homarus americanus TaxID=6706 RepID=UPI001C472716|nr:fatty acid-binding protein, liver-like [Homarus americanus]